MFTLIFSGFLIKILKNWKAFDQIKYHREFKENNFNLFFFLAGKNEER